MQDDPFPAAERILADIETVFKKDPELLEFDILPVTLNQNKSPVHHVEHCLGLESWCVRHVYCYTYRRLMDARQQRHRRTEPLILSRLLLGALLLNPDVPTFWNMRRELVQAGRLDIAAELHFAAVVLSRKPKSAEAFAHRKWLLGRILSTVADDVEAILGEELRVSQYAADHYANNYHAWQHRMWCMSRLMPLLSDPAGMLAKEWAASEVWVSTHVSDHSGLQYRQFLLAHMCNAPDSTCMALHQYLREATPRDPPKERQPCPKSRLVSSLSFVASDLLLNTDLIIRYTGHEALWCHRRFLLDKLKLILKSVWVESDSQDASSKCNKSQSNPGNKLFESQYSNNSRIENIESQNCVSQNNNHHKSIVADFSKLRGDSCNSKGDYSDKNNVRFSGKDQKLFSEEDEICRVVLKAIPLHEVQLLAKSGTEDMIQRNMADRHREWLIHILRLPGLVQ